MGIRSRWRPAYKSLGNSLAIDITTHVRKAQYGRPRQLAVPQGLARICRNALSEARASRKVFLELDQPGRPPNSGLCDPLIERTEAGQRLACAKTAMVSGQTL